MKEPDRTDTGADIESVWKMRMGPVTVIITAISKQPVRGLRAGLRRRLKEVFTGGES